MKRIIVVMSTILALLLTACTGDTAAERQEKVEAFRREQQLTEAREDITGYLEYGIGFTKYQAHNNKKRSSWLTYPDNIQFGQETSNLSDENIVWYHYLTEENLVDNVIADSKVNLTGYRILDQRQRLAFIEYPLTKSDLSRAFVIHDITSGVGDIVLEYETSPKAALKSWLYGNIFYYYDKEDHLNKFNIITKDHVKFDSLISKETLTRVYGSDSPINDQFERVLGFNKTTMVGSNLVLLTPSFSEDYSLDFLVINLESFHMTGFNFQSAEYIEALPQVEMMCGDDDSIFMITSFVKDQDIENYKSLNDYEQLKVRTYTFTELNIGRRSVIRSFDFDELLPLEINAKDGNAYVLGISFQDIDYAEEHLVGPLDYENALTCGLKNIYRVEYNNDLIKVMETHGGGVKIVDYTMYTYDFDPMNKSKGYHEVKFDLHKAFERVDED